MTIYKWRQITLQAEDAGTAVSNSVTYPDQPLLRVQA